MRLKAALIEAGVYTRDTVRQLPNQPDLFVCDLWHGLAEAKRTVGRCSVVSRHRPRSSTSVLASTMKC